MTYDDEIEVNFDAAEDRGTPPWEQLVPAGWYDLEIIRVEMRKGDTGPAWSMKLENKAENLQVDEWFGLGDDDIWKLKRLYKGLNLEHHGKLIIRRSDVLGKTVVAFLKPIKLKNGDTRMKCDKFRDPEEQRAGVPDRPEPVTYKPRATTKRDEVPF